MTRQTKKNIEYTLSTFAVEGLKPSKEAIKLCEQMGSIYCYKDSHVLRNKLGIRDFETLKQVEADITARGFGAMLEKEQLNVCK